MRDAEKRRTQAEQQAQLLRGQLEQQRLDWQGLSVRRKALQDQLQEDATTCTACSAHSCRCERAELGSGAGAAEPAHSASGADQPAAIDEYQQQSERKRYLDAQNDDLVEALDTLENVIRKIDRETRNRFKETFDQINSGLQALFRKSSAAATLIWNLPGKIYSIPGWRSWQGRPERRTARSTCFPVEKGVDGAGIGICHLPA